MKEEKIRVNDTGQIAVRNLDAWWLPDVFIKREIGGTVYTVTGSYEGTTLLHTKLLRIMSKNMEDGE